MAAINHPSYVPKNLAQKIAKDANVSLDDATKVIQHLVEHIVENVQQGNAVTLQHFCKFSSKDIKAKTQRVPIKPTKANPNPEPKYKMVDIPPSHGMKITVLTATKKLLKSASDDEELTPEDTPIQQHSENETDDTVENVPEDKPKSKTTKKSAAKKTTTKKTPAAKKGGSKKKESLDSDSDGMEENSD